MTDPEPGPAEVRERLHKFAGTPQYQPIYLKEDITPDELAFIESHHNELPELDTIVAHRRLYPRNPRLAYQLCPLGVPTTTATRPTPASPGSPA